MRTLYVECKMGVAGDMLSAALLDLYDDPQKVVEELNEIGIPKVKYRLDDDEKCGIVGKHLTVLIDGKEETIGDNDCYSKKQDHIHHHHSLYEIEDIIESLNISKDIKSDIREVYELIAQAESKVHKRPVNEIHFHEIGNLDAIADITATCYLLHGLDLEKIIVSPINVGGGTVMCEHGVLPVPAPATAALLTGVPSYESETIRSELCTPTGAALVKYFAFEFAAQPVMTVKKIGYGMGKKNFPQANCVRAVLGETPENVDQVVELFCNVDDMTAEEIGFATEAIFDAGALEVYTTPIVMKKGRPAALLSCMCRLPDRDKILQAVFANTTTIGVREHVSNRYILSREIIKKDSPYGEIRVKRSFGYNVERTKFEYDDLSGIAKRTGKSVLDLKRELEKD